MQSFIVGDLNGKASVIYVTRGSTVVFRVLEPVIEKTQNTDAQLSLPRSRLELRSQDLRWFRVSSVRRPRIPGFSTSDSSWFQWFSRPRHFLIERHGVLFMRERIAIPCPKGFEIVDPLE